MRIKLYHYPKTRSARILWLARELAPDVTIEVVSLDLYAGDQYHPAYLSRFPLHAVPAVEIGLADGTTTTMTESGAIITAMADAFPDHGLAPACFSLSPARADYLQVLHTCGATLDMMLWQIRIHRHLLLEEQRDERIADRYERKFANEAMPMFLNRLKRHLYICGDRFTAADCMFGHVVLWAQTYGLCTDPEFLAYVDRLKNRTAFQAAFNDSSDFDPVPPRKIMESGVFLG